MSADEKWFFTIPEAVHFTGMGLTTIKTAIRNGDLVGYKRTNRTVIERPELIRWVKSGRST